MDKGELIKNSLVCPRCLKKIEIKKRECSNCGYKFKIKKNTPVFLTHGTQYINRLYETKSTNPYSPKSLRVIKSNANAKILDFGAGNPAKEELFDNVLRLEFVHYKSTDIVSTEENFPFANKTFDFVISESVFEHLKNPFRSATEIHRVLKSGGKVLIDTAFLQPVHADPYHYFNMTLDGLLEIFKMFRRIEAGVEPYQTASFAMNILRDNYISLISNTKTKKELEETIGRIDFVAYDKFIPNEKQYICAAGVYFIGEKK